MRIATKEGTLVSMLLILLVIVLGFGWRIKMLHDQITAHTEAIRILQEAVVFQLEPTDRITDHLLFLFEDLYGEADVGESAPKDLWQAPF